MSPATSRELNAAKFRAVGAFGLGIVLAIVDVIALLFAGVPA